MENHSKTVRVWDPLVRIFHWSLVLSFAIAYLSSEDGEGLHEISGYIAFGLILFRILWGFVGSQYARFSEFVYSPKTVIAYLRSLLTTNPKHYLGHNPAGGVAIFLLLALGLLISVSGLGLYWEIGDEDWFEELHEIAANVMLLVVGVHIAGVLVSSVLHKENLVRAMFNGYKQAVNAVSIPHHYTWLGISMLN